jgi:hypothetical protein
LPHLRLLKISLATLPSPVRFLVFFLVLRLSFILCFSLHLFQEVMIAMGSSLGQLRKLKRVIFCVKKHNTTDLLMYMVGIVRRWFHACPTLSHVDLPQYGRNIARRRRSDIPPVSKRCSSLCSSIPPSTCLSEWITNILLIHGRITDYNTDGRRSPSNISKVADSALVSLPSASPLPDYPTYPIHTGIRFTNHWIETRAPGTEISTISLPTNTRIGMVEFSGRGPNTWTWKAKQKHPYTPPQTLWMMIYPRGYIRDIEMYWLRWLTDPAVPKSPFPLELLAN